MIVVAKDRTIKDIISLLQGRALRYAITSDPGCLANMYELYVASVVNQTAGDHTNLPILRSRLPMHALHEKIYKISPFLHPSASFGPNGKFLPFHVNTNSFPSPEALYLIPTPYPSSPSSSALRFHRNCSTFPSREQATNTIGHLLRASASRIPFVAGLSDTSIPITPPFVLRHPAGALTKAPSNSRIKYGPGRWIALHCARTRSGGIEAAPGLGVAVGEGRLQTPRRSMPPSELPPMRRREKP